MKTKYRHIIKTISWRIVGTLDTIALGWLITGDPMVGVKIGGIELVTKMVFYYIHERLWFKFSPFQKVKSIEIKPQLKITINEDVE